ncbi:hypothetical protein C0995_012155 [Termitomyces sp. Mi166|nr:hypothetical protein C0995_012155 [Termitomyces sp. Mi166\
MHVQRAVVAVALAFTLFLPTAVAGNKSNVVRRDDLTVATDVCGDVDADLTVSNLGKRVNLGRINPQLPRSDVQLPPARRPGVSAWQSLRLHLQGWVHTLPCPETESMCLQSSLYRM